MGLDQQRFIDAKKSEQRDTKWAESPLDLSPLSKFIPAERVPVLEVRGARALRPTAERIRHADHLVDDGSPTKDKPYERPSRLGTAWDRYSRTRNRNGNVLADSEMMLTRAQIAAGEHYATDYEASMWGQVRVAKFEPSVSGAATGVPATRLDRRKSLWRAEAALSPRQPAMLQSIIFDGVTAEAYAKAMGMGELSDPLGPLRAALDNLAAHYGYS